MKKKFIFLFIICTALLNISPVFARKTLVEARRKACYLNQRKIEQALQQYEKNNEYQISSIVPDFDYNKIINILINKNYLDSVPSNPTDFCKIGFKTNSDCYTFFCSYHGSADQNIPPSDDFTKSTIDPNINKSLIELGLVFGFIIIVILIVKDFHNLAKKDKKNK